MSRQNRVTPEGAIVAAAWRGALVGNRGCLHVETPDGPVLGRRRWAHRAWVACALSFRGRRRAPMPPGRWTALFFWDEAAAFAAGHLPCGQCRHADHDRMRRAWTAAGLPGARAAERHRHLHAHRVRRDGTRVTPMAPAAGLPDGAVVVFGGCPALVIAGSAHRWCGDDAGGWAAAPEALPERVAALTPAPVLALFAAGYRPAWRLVGP